MNDQISIQLSFWTCNTTCYTSNLTKQSIQRKSNKVLVSIFSGQGERVADLGLEGLLYTLKVRQQLKYIFSSTTVKSKEMGL